MTLSPLNQLIANETVLSEYSSAEQHKYIYSVMAVPCFATTPPPSFLLWVTMQLANRCFTSSLALPPLDPPPSRWGGYHLTEGKRDWYCEKFFLWWKGVVRLIFGFLQIYKSLMKFIRKTINLLIYLYWYTLNCQFKFHQWRYTIGGHNVLRICAKFKPLTLIPWSKMNPSEPFRKSKNIYSLI